MKSASSKTKNFPLFSGHIKLLESIANSKIASVLIIGITGVFWYILNFVWPTPDLVSLGTGKMMPDMMPAGYSLAELQALLTQYGRIGREDYQLFLMTWDVVFPIAYSLFFGLLIWLSIHNLNIHQNLKWTLASLSFIAAGFDYLENIAMLWNIRAFPVLSNVVVGFGGVMTLCKNILSMVGMSTVIILALYQLYRLICKVK